MSGMRPHAHVCYSSCKFSHVFVVFQILSRCVNHGNQIFGIICSKIVYYKSLKECSVSRLIWGQMPRVCSDNLSCLSTRRADAAGLFLCGQLMQWSWKRVLTCGLWMLSLSALSGSTLCSSLCYPQTQPYMRPSPNLCVLPHPPPGTSGACKGSR